MNCLTARDMLDLSRPDEALLYDAQGNELPTAMFDEAARHIKSCPACQTAVRRREKFDERIGLMTRDVPIPAGLRERMLSGLAGEPLSQTPLSQTPGRPAVRSRRKMIISTAAACIVAALSVGIWGLVISRPAKMTMKEITGYALADGLQADDLPPLTQFRKGLAVQVPKTMTKLSYESPFRRLVDPQLADREIAVYFFPLSGRNGRKIAGRLVVIPAAFVKDLPAATSFPGETVYSKGFCTTSWVEGKFMYLCCVQGSEDDLLRLRPKTKQAA
jgi:hypothetical protein